MRAQEVGELENEGYNCPQKESKEVTVVGMGKMDGKRVVGRRRPIFLQSPDVRGIALPNKKICMKGPNYFGAHNN